MNAQEAEVAYRTLKSQLDSGHIQLDEYNQKIAELRYQDNTGTWWAINGADGSWLKWNGSTWESAFAQQAQPVQQGISQVNIPPHPTEQLGQPSYYIPPTVAPTQLAKEKKKRNWIGIGSLVFSILSWLIYPYICGILAICVGIYSIYKTRKTTGKIVFIAIAGIVIALASMILNLYYLDLFAPHILPSLK